MSKSRWVLALCGLLVVASTGCGGSGTKLFPVSGTVTFEDKPVEGASILFIPQGGAPSMGTTDASGKYTIATRGKPGVPAGGYTVTVSKQSNAGTGEAAAPAVSISSDEPSEEDKRKVMEQMQSMGARMRAADEKPAKDLLPYRYSLPDGSKLRATVTGDASKDVFDFPLTP